METSIMATAIIRNLWIWQDNSAKDHS